MKKYPRWAYLVAGAIATVGVLYAMGRYQAKKQMAAKADGTPASPAAPSTASTLTGPVLRTN